MTIGARLPLLLYLSEQEPHRCGSFGKAARLERFEVGRRACFRFCRVAFGQDDETRPALNTPSPEAQCARDRGDAFASLIKELDFSESGKLRGTGRSLCKMPMRTLGNSLGTGFFRSAVAASPYRPARINQLPFHRLPKVPRQVENRPIRPIPLDRRDRQIWRGRPVR